MFVTRPQTVSLIQRSLAEYSLFHRVLDIINSLQENICVVTDTFQNIANVNLLSQKRSHTRNNNLVF